VYRLLNRVNGLAYIGMTTRCIRARFLEHLSSARTGQDREINAAIREFGEENFCIERLGTATNWQDLGAVESAFIALYGTDVRGYNVRSEMSGSRVTSGPTATCPAPIRCICSGDPKRVVSIAWSAPQVAAANVVASVGFGARVRCLRRAHGFTQTQLAVRAGVVLKTVQRIESGYTTAPRGHVVAMTAAVFGVTTDYLLNGDVHSSSQVSA
jgi:DNA-binding XRE family transcriptional regulator